MYTLPIIHFTTMTDLLDALPTDTTLSQPLFCLGAQERRESRPGQHIPTTAVTISLDLRVITTRAIYCYRPLAETIYFSVMTQDERPSPREKRSAAWIAAERIADAMTETLTAQGYRCTRGIVDIGDAGPILGRAWPETMIA